MERIFRVEYETVVEVRVIGKLKFTFRYVAQRSGYDERDEPF